MKRLFVAAALAAAVAMPTAGLQAKTLRWASQGDILTFDPHAQNEGLNNTAASYVYESLLNYDEKFQLIEGLATSWRKESDLIWRFDLRRNVKFHDGTPFTAEDVVFSIERAMAPTSNFKIYTTGIQGARAVGSHTLLIYTNTPNPVLLRQLTELRIMSKAWSEKNRVTRPQDYVNKEETFAVRNANGTGPFMLKSREVDVRTVFAENPNWWGKAKKKGNVTEIVYTPIRQAATRTAALLSGEIDFVLDPAPQDLDRMRQNPNLKVVEGAENRTIFIGLDQDRNELLYSNIKGKNPFKDARVREALYRAIDINAIQRVVMRGLSAPTGAMLAPQVHGWSKELAQRMPFDPERARALLREAGYADNLEFTLDCPNNRYINDEAICQAIVGMWARVGVKARLNAMPRATYFAKIQQFDTSAYLLGWGVPTFDALYTLQSLMRSRGQGGDGNFNLGGYKNERVDQMVDQIKVETDLKKRDALIAEVQRIHAQEVGHIPLHDQVIPWAMRKNVNVVHRADNRLEATWVRID
jgi:peptide/nickel transport system substrate-binding protein